MWFWADGIRKSLADELLSELKSTGILLCWSIYVYLWIVASSVEFSTSPTHISQWIQEVCVWKYGAPLFTQVYRKLSAYPLLINSNICITIFNLMVVLFGVSCYVSTTSSCEKMVVVPFEAKFTQLSQLIRPPSIGDCLYKKPRQDVLFVTNVSMCKKNVSR